MFIPGTFILLLSITSFTYIFRLFFARFFL
ncbi:hypothetical protein [Clostridium phage Amboise]|nr:hypothetical protein [Clostridium phage Amboise]DAH78989.1 MAG TPA: hypothetical protein [Caudoviricetes sp.]